MKKVICHLLPVLLATSAYAQSPPKETVSWAIVTEPPITYEENGEFRGYGVEYIKMIQAELPQYHHVIYLAGNYKRLTNDVIAGPLTAAIGLFKTDERLHVMHFAKVPAFYFFNIQLAMRQETYKALKSPEQLSLHSILKDSNYVLGTSNGRKYSQEIQQILEDKTNRSSVNVFSQGNVSRSLLQMLDAGRIDFTLLYPEEASYLAINENRKSKIITVPLTETEMLSYSWPVVTKNAKGEKLASEITEALIKIRRQRKYRDLYKAWVSTNNHKKYDYNFSKNFLTVYED